MTFDEAKKLVILLGKLFPGQVNVEQAKLATRELQLYEFKYSHEAVKAHRKSFGFIEWPDFYKACQSPPAKDSSPKQAVPDQSFADVFRRTDPQLSEVTNDVEVIARTVRKWWVRAMNSPAAESYRKKYWGECFNMLLASACEKPWGEYSEMGAWARTWADSVFSEPDHFRLCLGELRGANVAAQLA